MNAFLVQCLVYPLYQLISGRRILSKWRKLEHTQWLPRFKIETLQTRQLHALLVHAYETVPYYQHAFDAAKITLPDIREQTGKVLCRLPLLTKSIIQERWSDLLSVASSSSKRIENHTGGSTGTPLRFYQDQGQWDWGSANKLRCNRWAGWDFGKRTLRLWGHPRDIKATQTIMGKLRGFALSEYTFDAFNFSGADMANLTNYIRRVHPQTIVAYASMLAHFASYLDERRILDLPTPDGIIASTDMLFPHHRTLIERVFRAPVFNRYGCREVTTIAAECEEHQGMHINTDRLVVEFVDEAGRPVEPGQPGRVVVTDLFNYAMPFIRYDIGDVAILDTECCPCGRGLPLMKELVGRYADILRTPDGQFVSASALTTILHKVPGLCQSQLVQKATDWLQVNVVRYPDYDDASEAIFGQHLARFFGPKMRITFNYVDEVPKTASGKTCFSISEIGDED